MVSLMDGRMDSARTPSGGPARCEALVVGAGPVGLCAALALCRRGRAVTMLEAEPEERIRSGSRAIFIHRESLERFEQVQPGLGARVAAHGLVWHTRRTLWRGREVYARHYPPPRLDALPPFTSLPQVETERILLEACKAAGVEIVFDARVAAVETTPEGVTLATADGASWTADYVIAADGARSAVRHALGIPMEGSRSLNTFVVVDVADDSAAPLERARVFHYEHPGVGGRNVLLVPFQGGWRIDLQCDEGDDLDAFGTAAGVRSWLAAVMPPSYAERVTWISTYQFLQVVARELVDRHCRVLLAGEAAHLFAPFGARGMNSGIVDAVTAAEAIDAAVGAFSAGEARDAVEEFARTRRAAAQYNCMAAGEALASQQNSDPLLLAERGLIAALAPYWEPAGAWLDAAPYGPTAGPSGGATGRY
jgi:3-(3-hydroxy-phenyl)propionate hydroxylase